MNDIIREIEAEQLKENAPEFRVGCQLRKMDFLNIPA